MKTLIIGLLMGSCAWPAFAASPDCAGIKQDKLRLACYDKGPGEAEKPAARITQAKTDKQEGEVFRSGSWHVSQSLDAMTDKKSCTALYKNAWTVQGTADNLYVSFRGRGGVKAYTFRVDDEPADSLQLASSAEKDLSAIILRPSFERIYNAKRVRLQVGTILGSLLVEDINLNGFKESVDYIRASCNS